MTWEGADGCQGAAFLTLPVLETSPGLSQRHALLGWGARTRPDSPLWGGRGSAGSWGAVFISIYCCRGGSSGPRLSQVRGDRWSQRGLVVPRGRELGAWGTAPSAPGCGEPALGCRGGIAAEASQKKAGGLSCLAACSAPEPWSCYGKQGGCRGWSRSPSSGRELLGPVLTGLGHAEAAGAESRPEGQGRSRPEGVGRRGVHGAAGLESLALSPQDTISRARRGWAAPGRACQAPLALE